MILHLLDSGREFAIHEDVLLEWLTARAAQRSSEPLEAALRDWEAVRERKQFAAAMVAAAQQERHTQ